MRASAKRAMICLYVILILTIPILVRLPTVSFPHLTEAEQQFYQDEQGRYYLTDPDSYYYVRNVKEHLDTGRFGDSIAEDGTPRDSLRFFPEGTKANNTPGIVLLTEAAWKPLNALFGTDIYEVEYCLSAVMAALTGLAAFLLIRRISGDIGGLVGGILVSCAPVFAQRTVFSRFDTDMFVILMDILLMLFLSEVLRAQSRGRKIGFSACFAVTAWVYSLCWTPEVVMVITGFTLFGGLLFAIWNQIANAKATKIGTRTNTSHDYSSLWVIAGCAVTALAGLIAIHGIGTIGSIFSFIPLKADSVTENGVLPNTMMLVSELTVPDWIPESFAQWFWNPDSAGSISVLTGVGGVMVLLLALAGIVWLIKQSIERYHRKDEQKLSISECRIYLCILLVTLVSWLFLVRYGFRFVEHLALPLGILAGSTIGWIGSRIRGKNGKIQWVRTGICAALLTATVIPAAADALGIITAIRPSVTGVSDKAMRWIREKAEDSEAVIASWWDYGYYYEEASGHPCLWDGGSMDSVRAILFSKALTAHNPELSRRILLMLSGSGNRAAEYLMERTDAETAFETIWEVLPLEKAETEKLLISHCGMSQEEAETAETLLHPAEPKETYLIITDTMMMQIGWFEYYADWDFSGNNPIPHSTTLRYTPDGYPIDSPEGQEYMDMVRERETLWRLYIDEEENDQFFRVFNQNDALEGISIWRVAMD